MAGRPPAPPVTIRVPGAGPPPELEPESASNTVDRSPRRRLVVLAVVLGVLATVAVTTGRSDPLPGTSSAQGISAKVVLAGRPPRGAQSVRLQLDVGVEPLTVGSASDRRLTVFGMGARGFGIVLTPPTPLVVPGDDGVGVMVFAEVSVADCAVEQSAPRALQVWVRRGSRAQAELVADSDPDVVRALDRLVARICNRPRG